MNAARVTMLLLAPSDVPVSFLGVAIAFVVVFLVFAGRLCASLRRGNREVADAIRDLAQAMRQSRDS